MLKFPLASDLESRQYRPGQEVELKSNPGVIDIIAEYDPLLVPPITLVNDPRPRYPEELELVHYSFRINNWLTKINNKQQKLTIQL